MKKKVLTLFFFITTFVSAGGWLIHWVGTAALAKYMSDKGYMPPSNEEMKACCTYVWKRIFHIPN
ncbi:MAG: hypothetical protein HFH87_09240 [Lachnospiraceae bacterium]|nr:hypothetical protein [Lachnospiraceae bacterium]